MKDRRKEMTDEDHIEEQLSERADCPWKCHPNDPKCLCERNDGEETQEDEEKAKADS